jgi:hypothetical protein
MPHRRKGWKNEGPRETLRTDNAIHKWQHKELLELGKGKMHKPQMIQATLPMRWASFVKRTYGTCATPTCDLFGETS